MSLVLKMPFVLSRAERKVLNWEVAWGGVKLKGRAKSDQRTDQRLTPVVENTLQP